MYAKRIIPCLDIKNGRVVKGTNFIALRDAGDPAGKVEQQLSSPSFENGGEPFGRVLLGDDDHGLVLVERLRRIDALEVADVLDEADQVEEEEDEGDHDGDAVQDAEIELVVEQDCGTGRCASSTG